MVCENFQKCIKEPQSITCWCKECRVESSEENITRKERGKRYNLQNPKHNKIIVYHVDGGIVRFESNTKACDYLYVLDTSKKSLAIFIELKGTSILQALKQIEETMGLLKEGLKGYIFLARIVCRSCPRITNDNEVLRLRKRLKKNHNVEISIEEGSMDDSILQEYE